MSKFKFGLNIFLDLVILGLIISLTYSWMITEASVGQNVDYNKSLVIVDSDIDVKLYVMENNEYVLQSPYFAEPIIDTKVLEPGKNQKFRFDLTNIKDVTAAVKIIFTEITGDVDVLGADLTFTNTSPSLFSFNLQDRIRYNQDRDYYYFDYIDYLEIAPHSTTSLYFNTSINKQATNDIMGSSILINKVMFIQP